MLVSHQSKSGLSGIKILVANPLNHASCEMKLLWDRFFSPTFPNCSIGLRSGDFVGQVNSSKLVCSSNHSQSIFALHCLCQHPVISVCIESYTQHSCDARCILTNTNFFSSFNHNSSFVGSHQTDQC